MNAPARVGTFALVLAGSLGIGAVAGEWAGPLDVAGSAEVEAPVRAASDLPAGGLLVAQDGYRLVTDQREVGTGEALAFTIVGPGGEPVEAYDEVHERELHLIVASRDLATYHHLHPERDGDGRWTTDIPALPPGPYRAFADFQPSGADRLTLGIDLLRPGNLPAPSPLRPRANDEVDGFDVRLARSGEAEDEVAITVSRDGDEVATEPYLGAAGHLVALRDGDLAYLHVHPLADEGGGEPVRFGIEFPSAGTYALFFDFQVDGEVHTARFVMDVGDEVGVPAEEGHTGEPDH